jgi:predicted RNase H-like HicB family nuclease
MIQKKKSSTAGNAMKAALHKRTPKLLKVEFDREEDGRWIADVPELPGVTVYGSTKEDALSRVQALALRVLADMIEENGSTATEVRFAVA